MSFITCRVKQKRVLTRVATPLANTDDDVAGLLLLAFQVVVQNDLGTLSVSRLRVQGGTGVMGNHAVSASEGILHRAPDVIARSRLLVPDVSSVTAELAGFECCGNSILVADGTTSGVDEPSTLKKEISVDNISDDGKTHLLEVREQLGVDEVASSVVERGVDGNDVALGNEVLQVFDTTSTDGLGSSFRESGVVVVNELLGAEGQHTLENAVANTASTDGTDDLSPGNVSICCSQKDEATAYFALQIECISGDFRHLPVTTCGHLVSGDEVSDEEQHVHDDVLGDGGNVGSGDLEDLDLAVDGGFQVNMVGADTSGDADLEVLGPLEEVGGEVSGMEGGSNQHLGIDDVLLEEALGALLVVADLKVTVSLWGD